MGKSPKKSVEKLHAQEREPGPANRELSDRLDHLMRERGLNPRTLSLKAGLSADGIRNIKVGRAASPRVSTLQKLADALEVPLSVLTVGFSPVEPLPPPPLPGPAQPPHQAPAPAQAAGGMLDIPEYGLLATTGGAPEIEEARVPTAIWRMPVDAAGARAAGGHMVIVRAPNSIPERGVQEGDRLLVDTSPATRVPSPPGSIFVTWDGIGHVLASVTASRGAMVWNLSYGGADHQVPVDEIRLVGRAVRKWGPM